MHFTVDSSSSSINSLTRIRSKLPTLAAAEARVANWVMQQPEKIMALSMAQVAQACGVSDTTVLRFCRNAGFQGYIDLKLSIARDLTSPTQVILDDITENDPPAVIARKVFISNIQALYDTLEVLDEQALVQAITLLQNARQILIVGVGTSAPIVHSMYNMLMRLGLNCKPQTDSYLQLMEVALLGPGDVVVGISQSGSSKDPVYTLKQAKAAGAATICITGNAESPITQYADVTLLSVAREARIEAIASRLAQMSIADALYVAVALNNIDVAIQNEKLIWDALLPKMF
ncbi:MAG: MurR/RpiR family transcriptional regulator [Anaerolineae bacterium]|nr:MurR/RpiR family transcriptional regulator [Anaerolineales bacterium]MCK6626062.1 MurR/RpiR family transcriptional regulator [Anaerolineae bacterium]MCQ3976114.1 MurR/RpiR family transcriptional regulator [Anaerolineae bacterium]